MPFRLTKYGDHDCTAAPLGTSEHTRVVIDNGAIPVFIHLVSCPHCEVRDQAVWALGNIAGDSTRCRDLVLSYDHHFSLLQSLLAAMDNPAFPASLSFIRNATWTISNLCRGKPPPRWSLIAKALPTLARLVHHSDEEVLVDVCWALSYICEPADRIQHLIALGLLPRLVELMAHTSPNVHTPALRCVGNVATGSAEQTDAVVASDALPMVGSLLLHVERRETKKEACWMVSNITAGSSSQIDAVCASGIVPHLVSRWAFIATPMHGLLSALPGCNVCRRYGSSNTKSSTSERRRRMRFVTPASAARFRL
jgi:importin subunit alpha-1